MAFTDLSCLCRLCLLPLNGTHFDCATDDNYDLRDTIKMVYNIDIKANDEYSTKVCHTCCDILLYITIQHSRIVEVQKSLPRIQRIKNKIRDFGKKKISEKKEHKQTMADTSTVDVEMIEIEPNYTKNVMTDDSKMDIETNEITLANASTAETRMDAGSQRLFGHLTTFKENRLPANAEHLLDNHSSAYDFDLNDYLIVPPSKPGIDINNNTKHSPSIFQLAKRFCGNFKNNVDRGIDEITKQLAHLRFVPC